MSTEKLPKAKPKIGKPTLCTPARIEAIADIVSKGNYIASACRIIGIGEKTGYQWLQWGERDLEANVKSVYSDYAQAIKRAEAEAEDRMIQVVREAAVDSKNWIAAMTFLERRHPERWGRKDRTAVTIDEHKPLIESPFRYTTGVASSRVVVAFGYIAS